MWAAACPVAGTAGAAYLASRGLWPGGEHPAVRWLPGTLTGRVDLRPRLPSAAVGCLVYGFTAGGQEGAPVFVQVEAIDRDGGRVEFRCSGKRPSVKDSTSESGRRVFVARPPSADRLWVCEGPLDALALALMLPAGFGVIGVAGTSGFKVAAVAWFPGEVVIAPDGDPPGARVAVELGTELAKRDARWRIVRPAAGLDWCDILREVRGKVDHT